MNYDTEDSISYIAVINSYFSECCGDSRMLTDTRPFNKDKLQCPMNITIMVITSFASRSSVFLRHVRTQVHMNATSCIPEIDFVPRSYNAERSSQQAIPRTFDYRRRKY